MPPVKRPGGVAPKPAAVAANAVNFGDLANYGGGFSLPPGRWSLYFDVRNHQALRADGTPAGAARLGVMVTAHPLDGGDAFEQFLSMGGKAHLSYAPDPNTGKGLIPIPGGPGAPLNNKTNWFLFLNSFYDCGLPAGTLTNDFTVIDGTWTVTGEMAEPEDRKGFGSSSTGEAGQEERRAGKIPVIVEILEGGKPWEGGGGMPPATAPATTKTGPKPLTRPTLAPPPPVEEEAGNDDVEAVGLSAAEAVLTASPDGLPKLKLRTEMFKEAGKHGAEMAQAVLDTYFKDDSTINTLLGPLGYKVAGVKIVAA